MTTSLAEAKSQVMKLSEKAFGTFCDDISGMFDVDMKYSQQERGSESIKGLEKHFGNLVAVTTVKAEGIANGTLHFVCDQQGLFILAGIIIMQPEQMILDSVKSGSPEKAGDMTNVFAEVGIAMIGAWDRVLRKELQDYGSLTYVDTFIGNPWDESEDKIKLFSSEEFEFITYQVANNTFPPFQYGVIFPKELFNDVPVSKTDELAVAEEKEDTKVTRGTAEGENSDVRGEEKALADKDKEKGESASKKGKEVTKSAGVSKSRPAKSKGRQKLKSVDTPLAIYAKDIMQKEVLWGTPDDNVQQTLTKIKQHDVGYVIIGRDKIPHGIVSKYDLTAALSPYLQPEFAKWRKPSDEASLKIRIKWIMSSPVKTINLETPLTEIMENMCQSGMRALPVVDQQGNVQGLVTVFDIFQGLIKHFCGE